MAKTKTVPGQLIDGIDDDIHSSEAEIVSPKVIPSTAELKHRSPIVGNRTKISQNIFYDEQRMKDVLTYELPPELDIRASQYEDDDPSFVTHLKRAHKYHAHKHCQGNENLH